MPVGQTVAEISRFLDFSGWQSERSRRSNCVTVPNVVEIACTAAKKLRFFDFSNMASVRHLGFVMRMYVPRRVFGGLYDCAKFGWNRFSSFDNMHVFQFCEFGLKMPIQAPKLMVFDLLNGEGAM